MKRALLLAMMLSAPALIHAGETRVPASKTPTAGITAPPRSIIEMPAAQGMNRAPVQDSKLAGGVLTPPQGWTGAFTTGSGSGGGGGGTTTTLTYQKGIWGTSTTYMNMPGCTSTSSPPSSVVTLALLLDPVDGDTYWWTSDAVTGWQSVPKTGCSKTWRMTPKSFTCTKGVDCPGN